MSELQDLFEKSNPIPKGVTRCGDHYAQMEYMLIEPYASGYAERFKGFVEGIKHQQAIIDNLKAQLNNMEACYIEKKKELEGLQGQVSEALEEIQRALNCCESTETACVLGELVKVLRGEHESNKNTV